MCRKKAAVRRQCLRKEIAFFTRRWQTKAKADVAILHHVQDEFMSLRRVRIRIKPRDELATGELALLID